MLIEKIEGTNLKISFEDHEDLLKNEELLDAKKALFVSKLQAVTPRLAKLSAYKRDYVFIPLESRNKLLIYVYVVGERNPYVFTYNPIAKEFSDKISASDFDYLTDTEGINYLEDRCKKIGVQQFLGYLTSDVVEKIETYIKDAENTSVDNIELF